MRGDEGDLARGAAATPPASSSARGLSPTRTVVPRARTTARVEVDRPRAGAARRIRRHVEAEATVEQHREDVVRPTQVVRELHAEGAVAAPAGSMVTRSRSKEVTASR